MKRIFPISAYMVSAVLMTFYILVLWDARTPDVNMVYRLYYINHELEKWPGPDGFDYAVGTPVFMSQEQRRCGSGWVDRNGMGSRLSGEGAWIYFDGLPEGELRLAIVIDNAGEENVLTASSNREALPLTMEKGWNGGEKRQLWTAPIKAEDGEISLFIKDTEDVWVKEIMIDEAGESLSGK